MGRGNQKGGKRTGGIASGYEPEFVRKVSERLYRMALAADAGGKHNTEWKNKAADRMIEEDGDGGIKFSRRAGAYDHLTRMYLRILKYDPENWE